MGDVWCTAVLLSIVLAFTVSVDSTPTASAMADEDVIKTEIVLLEETLKEQEERLAELESQKLSSWDAIPKINVVSDAIKQTKSDLKEKNRVLDGIELEKQKQERLKIWKEKSAKNKEIYSGYTKLVGITLSQSCITMIQNNVNVQCPTYEDLVQLDSSNVEFSGGFAIDNSTGFFHRMSSDFTESWRWYDHDDELRIIVDPQVGMAGDIKMITIESNFGVYFEPEDHNVTNNTRTYHQDRYIDGCRHAVISADNWKKTLPDTIFTLRNGCTVTGLEEKRHEELPVTEFDITTSRDWQHKAWLAESLENCKKICKEY